MAVPAAAGKTLLELSAEYRLAMTKIKHPLSVNDSRALLQTYSHPVSPVFDKFDDDNEREEYKVALNYFRAYAAVVPYLSKDFADLRGQSGRIESRLQQLETTLSRQQLWFAGIVLMWVFVAVLCVGLSWMLHHHHAQSLNSTVASMRHSIDSIPRFSVQQSPPAADQLLVSSLQHLIEQLRTAATTTQVTPPNVSTRESDQDNALSDYTPRYPLLLGAATPHVGPCVPIAPNAEDIELDDLRSSMRYYLTVGSTATEKKLSYLTANHMGMPYCYAIINTDYSRAIKYRNDEALIEMFNPMIFGVSAESLVQSRERHHECDRSSIYVRYETIWVRYEDAKGKKIERRFDGPLAYEMQHIAELQAGRFRCYDDIKDAVAAAIDQSLFRNTAPHKREHVRWELPNSAPTSNELPSPDERSNP